MSTDLLIKGTSDSLSLADIKSRYSDLERKVRGDSMLREVNARNMGNSAEAKQLQKLRYVKDALEMYKLCEGEFQERRDANLWHEDAEPTVTALSRALELVDRNVTEIHAPDKRLPTGEFLPIKFDISEFAEYYVHIQTETVGSFKRGSPNTTDIPLMQAAFKEWRDPVYSYYGGYILNRNEVALMAAAGMGRVSIDIAGIKARTLEKTANNHLNDLMIFGDADVGMPGWINHPSALRINAASAITLTSSPESDLRILNLAAQQAERLEPYRINSVQANAMVFSINMWRILTGKVFTFTPAGGTTVGTPAMSVLDKFLKDNPHIQMVDYLPDLDVNVLASKGLGSRERIIAFRRDPNYLRFQMTSPALSFLPPKEFGWGDIMRAAHFSTAGTLLYYLNSMVQVVLPAV